MKKIILVLFTLTLGAPINATAHEPGQNQSHGSNFYGHTPPKTVIHHHYVHPPINHSANRYYYSEPVARNLANRPTYARGQYGNATFSNALGAALGGLAGSKIGKGSGKLATTAAGTMFGYYLGGKLGEHNYR